MTIHAAQPPRHATHRGGSTGWRKAIRDGALIYRRSLAQSLRAPVFAFLFPSAFPVLVLLLMSELYRDLANVPGFPAVSVAAWMTPGVFLMAAMFGAGYSATGLITDLQSGYLDRLRLLPISPAAILLGRLAFDVSRVAVAGLVVLAVGVLLGAEMTLTGLPVVLALLALWTLAYGGLFYAVGLRTRSPESLGALIPLFMPVTMLSTAFVPDALVPGWISTLSAVNPYTYLVEGVRMFTTGSFSFGELGLAVAAATAAMLVTQLAAMRSFASLVAGD